MLQFWSDTHIHADGPTGVEVFLVAVENDYHFRAFSGVFRVVEKIVKGLHYDRIENKFVVGETLGQVLPD